MAKKCLTRRQNKRAKLVAKHIEKRAELTGVIKNPNASWKDKQAALLALEKLPRDSAKVRYANRCPETGRKHGYYRRFGLARGALRRLANWGELPGVVSSSW